MLRFNENESNVWPGTLLKTFENLPVTFERSAGWSRPVMVVEFQPFNPSR